MKTIEAQIPEPVLKQAEELAARENIPLEQFISLAIAQAVTAWKNEDVNQNETDTDNKTAEREKFLETLTEALNTEAPDRHSLSKGLGEGH
jgi:hypothetical protein